VLCYAMDMSGEVSLEEDGWVGDRQGGCRSITPKIPSESIRVASLKPYKTVISVLFQCQALLYSRLDL
jgi:hypothetical protein